MHSLKLITYNGSVTDLLSPMLLGNKNFPINIIQGPLAGVSCAPFRYLTWKFSKPAFSCTEMISCKSLNRQSKTSYQRYVAKDPREGPVCFQLAANDPAELAEATKRVTDYGADLIDLNCGCPVRKIRSKGAGSSLLTNPSTLYKLITAMKQNTHLPVSIKIRVQGPNEEKFNQEIARVVTEAGADFLIVHGRHWTEHYDVPCRYDEIQFFVDEMKIPVIGNGDISCKETLLQMLATGCAGVMISRAGVGQPWLIGKLIAELTNQPFSVPSYAQISAIFLEHIEQLEKLLGNEKFSILQSRKLAKYYARGLRNKKEFCLEVNDCEQINALKLICSRYFGTIPNPAQYPPISMAPVPHV